MRRHGVPGPVRGEIMHVARAVTVNETHIGRPARTVRTDGRTLYMYIINPTTASLQLTVLFNQIKHCREPLRC